MKLTDHYPLPWRISYLPEVHRPEVKFLMPQTSSTGNVVTYQAAFDREANSAIERIVAANGEEVPLGIEEPGLALGDEMISELVRMLNATK